MRLMQGTFEIENHAAAVALDLVTYGTHLTSYGWGIMAVLVRIAIAGGLFWAFARLGGSKPLPHFARTHGSGVSSN